MGGGGNMGEESDNPVEINVTAMADVTLCLCVFFLCSFQFKQLEGKVDTWLPKDGHLHGCCHHIIEEVRIFMKWDPERQVTVRKVGNRGVVANDAELVGIIESYRKDFEKAGRTGVPVVIDATEAVPWQDVVHLVDLCRSAKFSLITFAEPMR